MRDRNQDSQQDGKRSDHQTIAQFQIMVGQVGEIGRRRAQGDDREPIEQLGGCRDAALDQQDRNENDRQGKKSADMTEAKDMGNEIPKIGAEDRGKANHHPIATVEDGNMACLHGGAHQIG